MADKTYNGWTNYETWNVALWLGNGQGSVSYWEDRARDCFKWARDRGIGLTKREQAACDLADALKDEIEESAPDLGASMFADLLNAALSEVNWHEIAEHYFEDMAEEPEESEDDEDEAE